MIVNKKMREQLEEELFSKNEYGYAHQKEQFPSLTIEQIKYLRSKGLKTTYEYSPDVSVDIHPSCIACQARHILKYENHPSGSDKPFQVRCKGIPGALPPGTKKQLDKIATEKNISSDRALALMKSTVDSVAWAELMFGFRDDTKWMLRWYQKEILRCSARRQVVRMGRRGGKTFSMALKILHQIFTLKVSKGLDSEGKEVISGPDVIIVTPFQAQLINFFDEVEKLIKRNVDLSAEVTTEHGGSLYVKSPYFRMEFANGAKISGFVTGVEIRADGSSAGSLRGQSGQIMYLDEMDLIQPDVLDKVIIPILLTSPETYFYATSTPIGKAGRFYDLCFNHPDFVEIYLPTTVIPHWEQAKADLDYSDPRDDAFISEYMAQFIESTTSVFKVDLIVSAMKNYTYEDSDMENAVWWNNFARVKSRSDLIKCIGIDWNKNAGSEFVVVCYNPSSHAWWIAEAVNVSASQFNSIRFKEEVIRLNYKWKPDWIYADEGYGHHIIDDLLWEASRLQALGGKDRVDQQTALLTERLKKFNFSGKVELVDPVKNTLFNRTGKEFLVENAIRVFEEGRISFPATDNTLRQQMQNYTILRRHASNGRPVYGMRSEKIGDHRLDALMLALGGLFLEKHPLYSINARVADSTSTLIKKEQFEQKKGELNAPSTPGIALLEVKFKREEIRDKDGPTQNVLQTPGAHKPESRGNFLPSEKEKKSASILETLWHQQFEEKSNRHREAKMPSDFYIVRKGGKSARRGW